METPQGQGFQFLNAELNFSFCKQLKGIRIVLKSKLECGDSFLFYSCDGNGY